jgi:hypothetical protein
MKKLFIIGLAAIFCLALAGPATAAMKMGGAVSVDFGYVQFSKEAFGPGDTDVSQVHFANNKVFTRWNGRYESDDGKLVGMMELWGGATGQQFNAVTNQTTYNNDINWSYAYIVWRPIKNHSFQIGYQTTLFADQGPGPYPLLVGQLRGRTPTGYGDFNHGARQVGFRWMTRFSDAVRLEVALFDPGNSEGFGDFADGPAEERLYDALNRGRDIFSTFGFLPPDEQGDLRWYWRPEGHPENIGVTSIPSEVSKIPRIDVKLPLYFGGTRIAVSGTYGKQEYENIGSGVVDEGFDVYGFAANIRWPIGIFTLSAEGFYGQNLGSGPWGGAMGPTAKWAQAGWNPFTQKFEDCTNYGGWIGASIKLGPGPLGAYYSMAKDDVEWTASGINLKQESERTSFGIFYLLPLGKGFNMRPVINFYDDGDAKYSGNVVSDLGLEPSINKGTYMNAGIEFTLAF